MLAAFVGLVKIQCFIKKEDIFDDDGTLNVIKHEFSGKKLYILKNYDVILKKFYGDYMKLPPEDKRRPHHDYRVFRRD